jgi:hypothetical protein
VKLISIVGTLGDRLIRSRHPKRGRLAGQVMSLRDLSTKTGVSIATLSRVERGFLPDVTTLCRLCDWLNIKVMSNRPATLTVEDK